MTPLLLDTSAWVEHLRDTGSPACEAVGRYLGEAPLRVVVTPPVLMELLAGASDPQALALLERVLSALRVLGLDPGLDWHAAASLYRAVRRRGHTPRGLLDCLVAVVAERHGAVLVHRDADLARVAACLPGLRTVDLR